MSRKVSADGKKLIKQRRSELGWKYTDPLWAIATGKILHPDLDWEKEGVLDPYREISISSIRYFQGGKPIVDKNFNALCQALGLDPNLVAQNTSITTVQLSDLIDMPRHDFFCGRQAELAEIDAWLNQDGVPFLNIWGAPGIGKSALMAQWINQQTSFPQVVWRNVDCENSEQSCRDFISELVTMLSPGVGQSENRFTDFNKILSSQKILLVIDGNFNDDYLQWFKILSTQRHCSCIVVISDADLEIVISNRNLPKKRQIEGLDLQAVKQFWQHCTAAQELVTLDVGDDYFRLLKDRYDGNPIVLDSAIAMIVETYHGNLRKAMDETAVIPNYVEKILEGSFKACTYEQQQILIAMAQVEDWIGIEDIKLITQNSLPKHKYINYSEALRRSSILQAKWMDDEYRYAISTLWRKYIQRHPQLGIEK
jgi:NB-ARC domain